MSETSGLLRLDGLLPGSLEEPLLVIPSNIIINNLVESKTLHSVDVLDVAAPHYLLRTQVNGGVPERNPQ